MKDNHKQIIYVAGHTGMVGSAIVRLLDNNDNYSLLTQTSKELDLRNQPATFAFLREAKPDIVIIAAAKVGGIQANINFPATFLYDNLAIQNNLIQGAYEAGVQKLVFLGSSCIYPRLSPQPMKEDYLLTGPLEPTNEGYAIAKIAGIKLLEAYRKQNGFKSVALMPCNLYGTNDSFHPQHAHVLSSLVRKFVDAVDLREPVVSVWGTGVARREFMHVNDVARATLFFLENEVEELFLNVGWGDDVSIKELAHLIAESANFNGHIEWDNTKPEGMPRKCMDVSRMKQFGFMPTISLLEGINQTIHEYKQLKVTGKL